MKRYKTYWQLLFDINADKLTKEEVEKAMRQICFDKRRLLDETISRKESCGYAVFKHLTLTTNFDLRFLTCGNCRYFIEGPRYSVIDDDQFASWLISFYYLKQGTKIPSELLSINPKDIDRLEEVIKRTLPPKIAEELLRHLRERIQYCSKLKIVVTSNCELPYLWCPKRKIFGCPYFTPKTGTALMAVKAIV